MEHMDHWRDESEQHGQGLSRMSLDLVEGPLARDSRAAESLDASSALQEQALVVEADSEDDEEVDKEEEEEEEEESSDSDPPDPMSLFHRLHHAFRLDSRLEALEETRPPLLDSFDLQGVANLIKAGKARKIVCMVGAGISVNAGIPDFRSPSTGLYSRLAAYDLPHPEAVFELSYFRQRPETFFQLAKELLPGTYHPTAAHFFIKLLHDKGLLQRCFTQNVDSLESQTGLPRSLLVAAHGNFDTASCIECKTEHPVDYVREAILAEVVCRCTACNGLVKPDIVFFGEPLAKRFFELGESDLRQADLLIVMGTSLVVQPFASLINMVGPETPRLLINKEVVGSGDPFMALLMGLDSPKGFDFGKGNYRDALYLGDCDEGVRRLCELLGWEEELQDLQSSSDIRSVSLQNPAAPLPVPADLPLPAYPSSVD